MDQGFTRTNQKKNQTDNHFEKSFQGLCITLLRIFKNQLQINRHDK